MQLLEASARVEELEKLVETRELRTRAELEAQLARLAAQLGERDRTVAALEKKIVLDEKELARERKHTSSEAGQLAALREEVLRLTAKVEAKEKQLARTNLTIGALTVRGTAAGRAVVAVVAFVIVCLFACLLVCLFACLLVVRKAFFSLSHRHHHYNHYQLQSSFSVHKSLFIYFLRFQ